MSIDLRRSQSRTSDLRPRVSFNRDVHIKRYGKKGLPKIDEKPENEDNMKSRGRADGTDYNARRSSITEERTPRSSSMPPPAPTSLAKKIKQFFARKPTNDDQPKTRYKEYKEDYDRDRRRDSAPEAKNSWFRSLERPKKYYDRDEAPSRNLRYFGESDTEHTKNRYFTANRRSRYLADSTDDATDGEPTRYDSLVYLHAAQVRDIPASKQRPKDESLKPKRKHLTRSASLVGPWTPSHRPLSRSGGLRDTGTQTISRTPKVRQDFSSHPDPTQIHGGRQKLRELVFTGPSIDRSYRDFRGRI